MNIESLDTADATAQALDSARRFFRIHVATVVVTATVVLLILLGIASIPWWVSATYCATIAIVAIGFVVAAMIQVRHVSVRRVSARIELLIVTAALSMVQAIFILPVLICVFAPTFRS